MIRSDDLSNGSQEPVPLTERQAQVLAEIARYYDLTGQGCPSTHVARKLDIHHETAREYFATLYRKGWLVAENSPAQPRPPFLARR